MRVVFEKKFFSSSKLQFSFNIVKSDVQLKMRNFYYFENNFHYLKKKCALVKSKNSVFLKLLFRKKYCRKTSVTPLTRVKHQMTSFVCLGQKSFSQFRPVAPVWTRYQNARFFHFCASSVDKWNGENKYAPVKWLKQKKNCDSNYIVISNFEGDYSVATIVINLQKLQNIQ